MAYGSRRRDQADRDRGGRRDRRDRRDRDSIRRERDQRRESSKRDAVRSTASGRRNTAGRPSGYRRSPRRRLPPEIEALVETDPAFQVVTLDKRTWIDPYTGEAVAAPDGHQEAAKEFLIENETWIDRQAMVVEQLTAIAWRYDLLRLLPNEPRLRIFGRDGQGWLNPFNGEYVQSVSREDGRVTMKTVTAMSQTLVTCPEARQGIMLDAETLQEKAKRVSPTGSHASDGTDQRSGEHGTVFGLSEDLKRAQDVQANMLSDIPELDGWDICVHFTPHSGVSGDFYEVMPLADNRFLLVIGDVSGHGMQAALVVATALKTLRMLAKRSTKLVDLIGDLNDEIKGDLLPGQFITLFAGIFDPIEATMSMVLAGHHPLLQINPNKNEMLTKVGRSGMAVGLLSGHLFRQSLKEDRIGIDQGDILVQYTDGLVEAVDDREQEFGLHRVCGSLLNYYEDGTQGMIDNAVQDVVHYSGGNPDDDLTLLAVARLNPPTDED